MSQMRKYEFITLILRKKKSAFTQHINIATNQSLNQKVPMFLHRGFVFPYKNYFLEIL